jgi:hypothetical protein
MYFFIQENVMSDVQSQDLIDSQPAMAIDYAEELSAVYQWPIGNYGKYDE